MALNRPDKFKELATDIALAVTLVGSSAFLIWVWVTGARLDHLIGQAVVARGAGDIAAFEAYRASAGALLRLSQAQQPWLYAGYFGVALVLMSLLSRWMDKVRNPAA